MPNIILPYHISNEFIKLHPIWIFIYGNDYLEKGCLGQSWACGREKNTFAVPTLFKICNSSTDKYFMDSAFDRFKKMIDEKIALIPRDGRPIILFRKLGEGHSQMKTKAPLLYKYLMEQLSLIATPSETDYTGTIYPIYNN